nr:TetR/AcrR family transcriptional regulator [Planosporangium flavigriseum]
MTVSVTFNPVPAPANHDATASDAPLGLRKRKKLETFRALQSSAQRLVYERGLDNVTIDEIAEAANVSKRTFFNYFDSKEAAIVEAEPGRVEWFTAALAARPADETLVQALWAVGAATLVRDGCKLQEVAKLVSANPQLVAHQVAAFVPYREAIVEWAAERTGVDPAIDFYPELLARAMNLMLNMTVSRWRPESGVEGFVQLATEIYAQLADGLAAR